MIKMMNEWIIELVFFFFFPTVKQDLSVEDKGLFLGLMFVIVSTVTCVEENYPTLIGPERIINNYDPMETTCRMFTRDVIAAMMVENTLWVVCNVKAGPNARNISTQHLATLLHVGTCVQRAGQTHATSLTFRCLCLYALGPWRATRWPSAHALVQQCCVKFGQTSTTLCNIENVVRKIWPLWTLIQHVATYRNRVAKCLQHVVHNNVSSVWPVLDICCLCHPSWRPCRNVQTTNE